MNQKEVDTETFVIDCENGNIYHAIQPNKNLIRCIGMNCDHYLEMGPSQYARHFVAGIFKRVHQG